MVQLYMVSDTLATAEETNRGKLFFYIVVV